MIDKSFIFSGPCTFDNAPHIVEGHYYIMEREDERNPTPTFRVLNIFFKILSPQTGQPVHIAQYFCQIFIDGSLCSIGRALNQRPDPYLHPFFQELKSVVMEDYMSHETKL